MPVSSEATTVMVKLLEEGTDVWRPVPATRLSETTYVLGRVGGGHDEETWEFPPGSHVLVEVRRLSGGDQLVAVSFAPAVQP